VEVLVYPPGKGRGGSARCSGPTREREAK